MHDMVPPPIDDKLGKPTLKWIKSADDDSMYYEVTQAALVMATAGYLDEANDLLQCLWKHKWPHSENVWLPDQSFEVLWFAAGKRPDFVPFPQKSIDEIELAHRNYLARDKWELMVVGNLAQGTFRYESRPMPTGNWESLDGLDLIRKSMFLACPKSDGPMPSTHDELEALKGLQKWIEKWEDEVSNSTRVEFDRALCVAAELAAKNGQTEKAEQICKLWVSMLIKCDGAFSFPSLTSNRYLARLFLQGLLAEPLGLTKEACQLYLKSLKSTVDTRMKRGRRLMYGKWTWEKLLATASKQSIKNEPDQFTKEQRKGKWIGRDHAMDEAIKAVETRLQTRLPADYVEFLRASNGFSALSSTAPPLLSVQDIGWLKEKVDAQTLAILKEYPGDDLPQVLESCLLVSEQIETDMVLLIPPRTNSSSWQCWFFAHWIPGEIRYPSFRHYFEESFARSKDQSI
jgi:hypothetical protein